MNITQKSLINKICAMLVIFALTMSDFLLVGSSAISYALDETKTNNSNIEFSAYFENENGEKQEKIEKTIDKKGEKLMLEVTVKNEGYFTGSIKLLDSNFKFVNNEEKIEGVEKIGESEITLDQINAGVTRKIAVEIESVSQEKIDSTYLSKPSKIQIEGKYVNSKNIEKEKYIDIKGTTNVEVDWKSSENTNLEIEGKLLTNSVYNINGESKKIVQMQINSKITNNNYPIKNTEINLFVPEKVESVNVYARNTNATNSLVEFGQSNYTYSKENKKLTINVANEDEKNISWSKDAVDTYIVTYVLDKSENINDKDIEIEAKAKLYDEKEIAAKQNVHIDGEIDGVVSGSIENKETSIYKGKIYTGEERNYEEINKIDIDYLDIIDEIKIEQKESKYIENEAQKDSNILYKQTRISKAEFLNLFGQNGYITVKQSNGTVIANINKDSQTDENGKIVINYPEGEKSVELDASKPVKLGTLNIENTKTINNTSYSREEIEKISKIKEEMTINGKEITSEIALNETESLADIKIDVTKISTVAEKQTLTIDGTLQANDESKDLYKNPEVKIRLPKEMEIKSAAYATLYKNGLEIEDAKTEKDENGNPVVVIKFKGEQTKYDISGGTKICVKLEVATDKLTPSKESQIEMEYKNENKNVQKNVSTKIEFESQYGLMIYNKISNINNMGDTIYTIDNETAYGELNANTVAKDITLNTTLINNFEDTISNVTLIGKIPAKEDDENFVAKLNQLDTQNQKINVLYSTNVDAKEDDESWNNYVEDAKSYKITVDQMEKEEKIEFNVPITIPENLRYNKKGTLYSEVTCMYQGKTQSNNSSLVLATKAGMGTTSSEKVEEKTTQNGIDTQITTLIGNDSLTQNDTVYENQTIRYKVTVKNNTGKDYQNVEIKANQKNGYVWDNVQKVIYNEYYKKDITEHYYEVTDKNEVTLGKIESLKNGESYTFEYEANSYQLNDKNIDGTETYGTINITSEDKTLNETIETIKNTIKNAELNVSIINVMSNEIEIPSGTSVKSKLQIKNVTDKVQKDVAVTIVYSSNLTPSMVIPDEYKDQVSYQGEETKEDLKYVKLKISSIQPSETIGISLLPYTKADLGAGKVEETWTMAEAISEAKNSYISNKLTRNVADHSKNFEISQQVKYEDGKDFNVETDKLNNGDKVKFITTIKNNEKSDQNVELQYNLDKMIEIQSATLKTSTQNEDILKEISYNNLQKYSQEIKAGETLEITVDGTIDTLDIESLTNKLSISDNANQRITNKDLTVSVNKTTDPEDKDDDQNDPNNNNQNGENGNSNNNNNNNSSNNQNSNSKADQNDVEKNTYTLSGTAWMDKDKDGKKGQEDEVLSGIEVVALDAATGAVRDTVKTDENGKYQFELQEGQYILVFKYDNSLYTTTTYQLNGADESENSDAIGREVTIDGKTLTAGTTDTITLNKNMNSIDIGLILRSSFNLKISKYVSKITVTNDSKTSTYEQKENTTLAKAEIRAKNLSDSLVVIDYKIKVTNEGEVAGYARNIVDYMPKTLSFNSNLNSDWYMSGDNLYNTSLANTKIEPGETKELTLVLTKKMTDSNTGLVNNKASIEETSNDFGAKNESKDKGSADVIISVSTGALVNYVATTVVTLVILAGLALLVNKKFLSKKI